MKFGSKKDSKGNEIQGINSGGSLPEAGFVDNCKITYIGPDLDQDGNTVEDRARVTFAQPNGTEVHYKLLKPSGKEGEEWQLDALNKNVKHIATKMVDDDTFHSECEAESFKDFVKKFKKLIEENGGFTKLFRVAFSWQKSKGNGKYYLNVRVFPNFIESMEVPKEKTTLHWSPEYDFMENPDYKTEEDAPTSEAESGEPEW